MARQGVQRGPPTASPEFPDEVVSATQRSNAWAVGYPRPHTCSPRCGTVIEHWNGTSWTQVPSPPGTYLNDLLGVPAIGCDYAWAVGTTDCAST